MYLQLNIYFKFLYFIYTGTRQNCKGDTFSPEVSFLHHHTFVQFFVVYGLVVKGLVHPYKKVPDAILRSLSKMR